MSASLARTGLRLLPLQLALRGLEAAYPVILAVWFGRSAATDAYFFAAAVFGVAGALVYGAFQDSALHPILAAARTRRPEALPAIRAALLGHVLALGAAIAGVVAVLALVLFRLRFGAGEGWTLAASMTTPLVLALVLQGARIYLGATLAAEHRYADAALAAGAGAATALLLLALLHVRVGILAVAWSTLGGELVGLAVVAARARRAGHSLRVSLARPPEVVELARLVGSELAGGAVTRLNAPVDQLLAGVAGVAGGGSLLRYAGDLALLPTSLLQATFLTPFLARTSEAAARDDVAEVARTVRRALVGVMALLGVAGAVLCIFRVPLTALVFGHGRMDEAGVLGAADLVPCYVVGLPGFGALLVLARAHVALRNSRIMVRLGVCNAVLNLVLDAALVGPLGLRGIALATSITHVLVAIVFWRALVLRYRELRALASAASPSPSPSLREAA